MYEMNRSNEELQYGKFLRYLKHPINPSSNFSHFIPHFSHFRHRMPQPAKHVIIFAVAFEVFVRGIIFHLKE